jgi:hypothetical protein
MSCTFMDRDTLTQFKVLDRDITPFASRLVGRESFISGYFINEL